MCLAVPSKLISVEAGSDPAMGRVELGGVVRRVCLAHVPDAVPGDYVLVHVGFALTRIDEVEAARVFALLEELGAIADLERDLALVDHDAGADEVAS